MSKKTVLLILVAVVGFVQYINTLQHEFAWDDKIVIEENPRVLKGFSGIPDLFVKYNSQFRNDRYGYRPIVLTSFAVEIGLGGKKNPGLHHFMNVVYYSLLVLVLFIFLQRLFRNYSMYLAFFITLIFAVHPLHVEVVANIKSRDEIFALLFTLLSFLVFLRFLDDGKWWRIPLASLLYLLAYVSKENAFTTLAVYPLIAWIRGVSWKRIVVYNLHIPLLALLSIVILRLSESSELGKDLAAGLGVHEEDPMLGNSLFYMYGWGVKLANALNILIHYLKLYLIPYPLIYYYGYNQIPITSWSDPIVWFSLLAHAGLLALGLRFRKTNKLILFGFLFYLATIFLYTHLLRPLADTMADRFMFMPSLGLTIMLVGLISQLLRFTWPVPKKLPSVKEFILQNRTISLILLPIMVIFAILTWVRNPVWKNDLTLTRHDVQFMDNSSRGHFYYATQLNKQIMAKPMLQAKLEPEMVKHYKRAIEITDSAYYAYLELGIYYCNRNRLDEGIPILKRATEIYPNAADPAFFLGQAYVHKEQYALAVPQLELSMRNAPKQWGSYYFLAIAYSKTGRFAEGETVARDGLGKFPGFEVQFYDALGHLAFDKGDIELSVEYTLKMLEYGGKPEDVYGRIIGRYYAKGDKEKGDYWLDVARQKGIVFNNLGYQPQH